MGSSLEKTGSKMCFFLHHVDWVIVELVVQRSFLAVYAAVFGCEPLGFMSGLGWPQRLTQQ
jgi:hypothetical protein